MAALFIGGRGRGGPGAAAAAVALAGGQHWNGQSRGQHASATQPAGYEFDPCAMAATSASNVWGSGQTKPLIVHWNGSGWKVQYSRSRREEPRVSVELNHTIVACRDQHRSAAFLAEILGLPAATRFGRFLVVATDNGVSLDFAETDAEIATQHYAFLTGEDEFDVIFGRITERDVPYWADPGRTRPGETNSNDGGRGVYFADPDGHVMEIITRPYGSGNS
ncbi:MAG TPA: VOC family protein [Streptosporangiaceae bacterium]|nr:VOC family protein [Streptosporangiaceae bacterium]